jgi:hypothetical protein
MMMSNLGREGGEFYIILIPPKEAHRYTPWTSTPVLYPRVRSRNDKLFRHKTSPSVLTTGRTSRRSVIRLCANQSRSYQNVRYPDLPKIARP